MDISKRNKTIESETKDSLFLIPIAITRTAAFVPVPKPQYTWDNMKQARWH